MSVFLLYFGFNFLKGVDIFSPTSTYYGLYEHLDGLEASAPVYIKGCKVGQVKKVAYDFTLEIPFVVEISIDKEIRLPRSTEMQIYDDGLLGGKALQLIFDASANTSDGVRVSGDTLPTSHGNGLIDGLMTQVAPQLTQLLAHVDTLVVQANKLVADSAITHSIHSIEGITANLQASSAQLKLLMNRDVPDIVSNTKATIGHLNTFTANLNELQLNQTVEHLNQTVSQLQQITASINSSDGTIGLLLHDKQLYEKLTATAQAAQSLLSDLEDNPKRYVHFSIFGKKDKTK